MLKDGSFVGTSIQTPFGAVQIKISIVLGKIVDANALIYPNKDPRSKEIALNALPKLKQETLVAQSAQIATVSGASYTSMGWKQSLQAALGKAKK